MSWQPTDIWVVDIELPAGSRVEYKYVILEEQDWTRQVNEAVEGRVEYTYRTTPDAAPPDVQRITKQMAIVAWQAGTNRVLQVPSENELAQLRSSGINALRVQPAEGVPQQPVGVTAYGQQELGNREPAPETASQELSGVWERLSIDENGRPFLERRDVWGQGESPWR